MPIVDIEVVAGASDPKAIGREISQLLADELGTVFDSGPGDTWVRLRSLDPDQYAENRTAIDSDARPTFVHILRGDLPDPATLRREILAVAKVVARTLDRPREHVHVLYAPEASGRVGFGGVLPE